MHVHIDLQACEGHGECVVMAPDVFALDDDSDVVRLVDPAPPVERHAAVEQAAALCPVAAIVLGR